MYGQAAGTGVPTILVVDDQPGVRRLLQEVFALYGYGVVLAATGLEALAAARSYELAAVLLDLRMPGMSGLETLVELKKIVPSVPVVIITAVSNADAETAVELGAVCAVTKPFDVYELRSIIDSVLVLPSAHAEEDVVDCDARAADPRGEDKP